MMYTKIFSLVLISFLFSCTTKTKNKEVNRLEGLWKIEKVIGPHADNIRGGYFEFDLDSNFTFTSKKSSLSGVYINYQDHFKTKIDHYEVWDNYFYRFEKKYLVIIPEESTQKFYCIKVD